VQLINKVILFQPTINWRHVDNKLQVDLTIGSALDVFGGDVNFTDVCAWHHSNGTIGALEAASTVAAATAADGVNEPNKRPRTNDTSVPAVASE
jgi:hypothetical protein